MLEQAKIERLLRLIKMLTGNMSYTLPEIADRLEMSERTLYRYIETFKDAGFVVKKNGNIFKLDKDSPHFKDISDLLHFTEEESHILQKAIDSIAETNIYKQNLKKKLGTLYDYKILAETTHKGIIADNINLLTDAITASKQVLLRQYQSAKSNDITDRLIEPYAFTTNYVQIWAYEPASNQNKLFKVSRIGKVELLNTPFQYKSKHKMGNMDLFRMSSDQLYPVKIKMSIRAAMLLMEEYPLAEKEMVQTSENEWILETKVCSYEGIGRFVIGLCDEITILESSQFKRFLAEKVGGLLFD
jgi:predicted DNA-binding transcriptional regulator YafY